MFELYEAATNLVEAMFEPHEAATTDNFIDIQDGMWYLYWHNLPLTISTDVYTLASPPEADSDDEDDQSDRSSISDQSMFIAFPTAETDGLGDPFDANNWRHADNVIQDWDQDEQDLDDTLEPPLHFPTPDQCSVPEQVFMIHF